ncbi:MAG: uracil-DNA glycosylase family protein [Pyrinomonadaceae bacterium]
MSQSSDLTELIADVRERILYFQEMGVNSLDVKLPEKVGRGRVAESNSSSDSKQFQISNFKSEISNKEFTSEITKPAEPRRTGQSRLASLPSLSKRDSSVPFRNTGTGGTDGTAKMEKPEETLFEAAPTLPEPTETIPAIRAEIGPDCTRCKLSTLGRSQVVNSVGNFDADLMFVGEAPGADEDAQGEPFVGRAGQLLTKIIEGIGLRREDVFIGNINRCRPPGNRAPEPDETTACKPFLKREVAVVRPKVIVVLGATAAQNLLETKVPIGKLRGQFHDYLGVKVMPTFHPAYLLRDPHKKREVWEDMKMVRDYLRNT